MKQKTARSTLSKQSWVLKQIDKLPFLKSKKVTTELLDLILLFSLTIAIPLTWRILLGWDSSMTLANYDGLYGSQPFLQNFLRLQDSTNQHHWYSFLYHFLVSGGGSGHDASSIVPIYQLCSFLGLTPGASQNILVILIQIMISFFSIRAVIDLSTFLNQTPPSSSTFKKPLSLSAGVSILWITAFSPAIGWRIFHGHELLLLGIFVFLVSLSIIVSSLQNRLGLLQTILAVSSLVHAFSSAGQQLVFYSFIFGFPILCSLLYYSLKNSKKRFGLLVCFFILLSAFGIAMPQFYSMFTYATGPDAGRAVATSSLTYSYVTATLRDWLSSIPWTLQLIPIHRNQFLWHEVNYAFGPTLLLFLLLWNWKRRRDMGMGIGIVVSALVAVLFSMNQWPFSQMLLSIIPLLNSFRVPERAILPFVTILPIVAIISLLQTRNFLSSPSRNNRPLIELVHAGILIIGLFLLPLIPADIREILLWVLALGTAIALILRFNFRFSRHAAEILLILLGISGLSAFKERVPGFESANKILSIAENVGNHARLLRPALNSSLVRAKVDFEIRGLQVNTAQSMWISSIEGYWNPLVRFMKLVAGLEGRPLDRTRNHYQFPSNSVLFKNLSQLYNVQYIIKHENNQMLVVPSGPTAGPAWFSGSIASLPSFNQLGNVLNQNGEQIFRRVHEVAWILSDDPIIQEMKVPKQIDPICSTSKVIDVKAPLHGQSIRLTVENASLCPLTVSLNFSSLFKAYSLNGDATKNLELFPIYGTLTGIWVPAGVKEILLQPERNKTVFSETLFYAGWFLLLAILIIIAKTKEEVEPPPHKT